MTLTSLPFYLLVLALLVLYYLVPKRFQWVVLLIGSYAFYAFVCLRYMGFIVVTTLTTYFGARGMDAMTARMEQTVAAHKQDFTCRSKIQSLCCRGYLHSRQPEGCRRKPN